VPRRVGWHVLAHVVARMALDGQAQATLFDPGHADGDLRAAARNRLGVGQQPVVGEDRRQVVRIGDVVNPCSGGSVTAPRAHLSARGSFCERWACVAMLDGESTFDVGPVVNRRASAQSGFADEAVHAPGSTSRADRLRGVADGGGSTS
jgi:hypothetical protein